MKKMVKVFVALTAAMAMGVSAFAETTITAYNRIKSGIVDISIPKSGDTSVSFSGLTERAYVEVTSDKVDAMVKAEAKLGTDEAINSKLEKYTYVKLGEAGFAAADWYIEFRPFDMVTIGFHDAIMMDGTYLPVYDDNLSAGNLGSDLVLCLRPIKGLRLCAGMDFEADFGKAGSVPVLNFGADYAYNDFGAAGVTFRNAAGKDGDNWDATVGVYASLTKVEDLTANVGYAYNADLSDEVGIAGDHIFSLGTTYGFNEFGVGLDFVTNFGASGAYDMYLALCPSYDINDDMAGGLAVSSCFSVDGDTDYTVDICPYFDLTIGKNKFEFAFDVAIANDDVTLSFPCYWKYNF